MGCEEETWFSFIATPLRNEIGASEGYHQTSHETTRQCILDRRTETIFSTEAASDMVSFWKDMLEVLKSNEVALPLVVIYSLDEHTGTFIESSDSRVCEFCSALGIAEHHLSIPKRANLATSEEGFIPLFRQTLGSERPLVFSKESWDLSASVLLDIQWRGFDETATDFVVSRLFVNFDTYRFLHSGLHIKDHTMMTSESLFS